MKAPATITAALISFFCYCQSPAYQWAGTFGGTGYDMGRSIAVDRNGNVVTTGYFAGTADLDPTAGTLTATATGTIDIFITKVDVSGNLLWSRVISGSRLEYANSVATDLAGNVIVCGKFSGTADFDPGSGTHTLTTADSTDLFILKLDGSGNFMWAHAMGGNGEDEARSVRTDGQGNVFLAGHFHESVNFDTGQGVHVVTSNGERDMFICKLNAAGMMQWAQGIGGTWYDYINAIDVDRDGAVYATGSFYKKVDFDAGPGTYTLGSNFTYYKLFVLKLDGGGVIQWAREINNGQTNRYDEGIRADAAGNVYVTSCFAGTVDFDPGPGVYQRACLQNHERFILKLNSAGQFVWARPTGESTYVSGNNSIAVDSAGFVYTTGGFYGVSEFDPGFGTYTLQPSGADDVFVLQLDSAGIFKWAVKIGGNSADRACGIEADGRGNVFITGSFRLGVDFDPGAGVATFSSAGAEDVFILKLNDCTAPTQQIDITPAAEKVRCVNEVAKLEVHGYGGTRWYTSPTGGTPVGSGTPFYTPPFTGTKTYYAEAVACAESTVRTAVTISARVCTGVDDQTAEGNFVMFPNPAAGNLSILLENSITIESIEIVNAVGQRVEVISVAGAPEVRISCSGFAPGIYYVTGFGGGRQLVRAKLVVAD